MDDANEMFPKRERNPLVLLGAVTTAGVLIGGLAAFKRGNSVLSQQMMRARVMFQGATVALMVTSSGAYSMLMVGTTERAGLTTPEAAATPNTKTD